MSVQTPTLSDNGPKKVKEMPPKSKHYFQCMDFESDPPLGITHYSLYIHRKKYLDLDENAQNHPWILPVISTEGALRRPMTYDNYPIPSQTWEKHKN